VRVLNLLRTVAFRIVLVYILLFAVSAAAIVWFTYWNTKRSLDRETDQTIDAEVTGLAEQYQRLGLPGLADVILSRSIHEGQGLYLLTDGEDHVIAGNLESWPPIDHTYGDFIEFDYRRRVGDQLERHRARGRIFPLTEGFRLLIARDIQERYKSQKLFTTTLPWSLALMLGLGVLGGALISWNLLTRLDSINRASREIMAGDLSRRIPVTRARDEYDTLAQNLNRMLDRIERLMRGMRDVTDSIAHDLRTPLNRLRNRLEGIMLHLSPDTREYAEVESAVDETDQLIGTFNALLLIAEAEAGVAREKMEPVALPAVVEGVAELYAPLAEEKGISLEIAPSGSATIAGNKRLISQALANLIDNAIKYTPASGSVKVAVEDRPSGVALSVADSGPGIPAEDRAHVVERFVRLEASRNSPGTGLGLSLVAAVARLHDAKLELDDNRPGLKATLVFPGGFNRPALPKPRALAPG
jgi:signal transduction histidine kinase